jgi:hypothetical protein
MGNLEQEEMFNTVDSQIKESGVYMLQPKFISNYYEQIKDKDDKAAF